MTKFSDLVASLSAAYKNNEKEVDKILIQEELLYRLDIRPLHELYRLRWSKPMRPNGYEALLFDIFPIENFALMVREEFMRMLKDGTLPDSKSETESLITQSMLHKVIEGVWTRPVNPPEEKLFEEVLKTLTPREEGVIRKRFGINMELHTLEQVGEFYGITRERVRQIESKAIRKLRHPSRSRRLKPLTLPLKTRLAETISILASLELGETDFTKQEQYLQKIEYVQSLKKQLDTAHAYIQALEQRLEGIIHEPIFEHKDSLLLLGKSIDDCEFSLRTYNCLKKGKINNIGELLQKTEKDLVKIRCFGKKSLTEVKDFLKSLGLQLKQ